MLIIIHIIYKYTVYRIAAAISLHLINMDKRVIFVLLFSVLTVFCDDTSDGPNCTMFQTGNNLDNLTEDIYFLYYYGPTVNNYTKISYKNGLTIADQTHFDINKETVFYLPGWTEKPTDSTDSTYPIAEAFLSRDIVNFVALDYSELVQGGSYFQYLDSFRNVSDIGEAIGQFLKCYIPKKQALEYIHLVGHSLGAQIMSHAAREYGEGKLKWLTGLDPAGPLFNLPLVEHLSKTDGEFVDVIHTDCYFYGDGRSIGHVDFFPNMGRRVQPSCPTNRTYEFCSHHMSWRFYAESVRNETYYPATKCHHNWFCNSFGITLNFPFCCDKNAPINHMGYGVDKTDLGDFYLNTSPNRPYNLGEEGLYD